MLIRDFFENKHFYKAMIYTHNCDLKLSYISVIFT